MSEPTHNINIPIVTNASMAITINVQSGTSVPVNVDECVSFSIQAIYTGSPLGTIKIQCSNDSVSPVNGIPTNWTDVTDSAAGISAAGTYVLNVEFPAYSWIQLVYTPTSGSGTMNARINAKRR